MSFLSGSYSKALFLKTNSYKIQPNDQTTHLSFEYGKLYNISGAI